MYFCVAIAIKNGIKVGGGGCLRSHFIPKRPKKGQFRFQMIILRERTEFQDNLHFSQVELWLQKK